jgi:ParB family chromosome partitioning protein
VSVCYWKKNSRTTLRHFLILPELSFYDQLDKMFAAVRNTSEMIIRAYSNCLLQRPTIYFKVLSYQGVLEEININKIRQSRNQFRMNLDHIDELAASIKLHGLLQPIVVRPLQHEYEVVAGNRRLAAARFLKLRKITSHIIDLSDKESYEVGLVENVQRKTMNPIEEATAFSKYVDACGWGGLSELAAHIGRSQEFVTKRIQLLRLPDKIRNEIIRQRISPSVALEMLPLDEETMREFADFVVKNPLTKNEMRSVVKISRAKSKNVHDKTDEFDDRLSNNLSNEKELFLIDKALRKSIAVMKSTLVNFDDIVNNVNDDWILKELLTQYRMIIHGDIDTFLKLRKRLRIKIPRDYLNLQRSSEKGHLNDSNAEGDNARYPALYQYATRGIWQ